MSDDLHALKAWAGALLARLQPAQRCVINHKVAIDLRCSEAQRIKAQQGPDGTAYPARRPREEFNGKNGRIKRQKAAAFAKIRTSKHLKVRRPTTRSRSAFLDGWRAWRRCISLASKTALPQKAPSTSTWSGPCWV